MQIFIFILSLIALAAMGFGLVVLLVRFFVRPFRDDVLTALCPGEARPCRGKKLSLGRMLAFIAMVFLVSRLVIYVTGLICAFARGTAAAYWADPLSPWLRWDSRHYLGLARNGYVNEGDARFHLVFFPLYPMLVGLISRGTGLDAAWAGTILSNLCLFVSLAALFRLVEMEQGEAGARRACQFLALSPLGFFYAIPYSESLFLMLCVLSVLAARKRRMVIAVALGALAANCRLLGLLTAVPIYYEFLLMVKKKKAGWGRALFYVLCTLPVALGFLAYLYLNYRVSGHPLTFLTYQKEHWFQQMGSLWRTLGYTLENAFTYGDWALKWGTWIPQALSILGCVGLVTCLCTRMHPGDGAFALLYIYFAVSPTWLLSGIRYLSAMYPLYPMLALITGTRKREWLVTGLSLALSVYFISMYLLTSGVM